MLQIPPVRLLTLCESGTAEMVTYLPISSPFIRFASRYMDDAIGVAAGTVLFQPQHSHACTDLLLQATISSSSRPYWSPLRSLPAM